LAPSMAVRLDDVSVRISCANRNDRPRQVIHAVDVKFPHFGPL
jgi:hypothetical protein